MEWYLLAIVSAIFLSLANIVKKKVLLKEHTLELLSVSYMVAFFIQVPFIKLSHLIVDPYILGLIIFRSILFATAIILITKAIKHMEISSVVPLQNMSPLFLLVLSIIFLGERASFIQIIGVLVVVIGAYLLQVHSNYLNVLSHFKHFKNKYLSFVIIAMVLVSVCAILSKIILRFIPVQAFLFYTYGIVTIIYVVSQFVIYDGFKDIKAGFKDGKLWVILLGLLIITSDIFYFSAVAIPAAFVSLIIPIRRLSTLFSTIIGGSIFDDHYLKHKIISAMILLAGAVMIIIG